MKRITLIIGLLFATVVTVASVDAQVLCSQFGSGLACQDYSGPDRGPTFIQPSLGDRNGGAILSPDGSIEPYAVMPSPSEPRSREWRDERPSQRSVVPDSGRSSRPSLSDSLHRRFDGR